MNCWTNRALNNSNRHGHLTVIYGPMFSSKTDNLLILLSVGMGIGKKILIINNIIDERPGLESSGILTSHRDSPCRIKQAQQISVNRLEEVPKKEIDENDVIGIDEAQFFEDITLVFEWLKMGKTIITAGLMFTSESKPFGDYYMLLSHADKVIKLNAVCLPCMSELSKHGINLTIPAIMTKYLGSKKGDVLVGSEGYIPVCRFHYYQEENNSE